MRKIVERLKSLSVIHWLLVLGVFFRVRQYFSGRSLWVDEASLAVNIVNRTFSELTLPLDFDQGAPLGFLFIEKLLILIFGNYDYILRLFPLFSGLVALYFMYKLADKHFGKFGMIAILFFLFSDSMIYYSSELKQYASDVMISLLLIYFSLQCFTQESRSRDIFVVGAVGIMAIWVSHTSIFILPIIGILLVIDKFFKREYAQLRLVFGAGILWVSTFTFIYFISLRYLAGNDNLQEYWSHSFAPLPPWRHFDWYQISLTSILPHIQPSFIPSIFPSFNQKYLLFLCFTLTALGICSLFLSKQKLAILLTFPLVLAFIASAIHFYPITDRFLFFWFPSLLLLMAEGLSVIYLWFARLNAKLAIGVYAFIALVLLWSPVLNAFNTVLHPDMGEDIKPILAYIKTHMQADDVIYVHHGDITPFLYYSPFYGLDEADVFLATKSRNFERYTIDVLNFQGTDRIWFIFSHVIYCDCDGTGGRTERVQSHTQLLDRYGIQLDHFEAERASTYLYDLQP